MSLADSTHTTIRILAGCFVLVALFYFISKSETTPKEHIVNLRVQMTPSK